MITARPIYLLFYQVTIPFINFRTYLQVSSQNFVRSSEVEAFCLKLGIDPRFNPEALGFDKSIDQCPKGSTALFCKHVEFSNICLARVLHFKVLCMASGYDPSLLSFRRFFRLAKNGDWFTFETSQVDICLISSMGMPFQASPFFELLLVLMGISTLWDKQDRDLVLMRDGQVMSALDFLKSDDTSKVVFSDAASAEGEDVVVRCAKHRFEGSGYVSVPNVKDVEVLDGGKKCELPLVAGKDAKAASKKLGGSKPSTKAIEGSSNVDPGEIYVPD
ncbi:hypothetical protein Hanom_Chr15g01395421 [Helianthus anomalus]